MTTWLTVLVAWLAALASGWERVLQADRAIDRWTAEITKTKHASFVAGLVFVFYAIAVYVVLSWTVIGRRVSYRLGFFLASLRRLPQGCASSAIPRKLQTISSFFFRRRVRLTSGRLPGQITVPQLDQVDLRRAQEWPAQLKVRHSHA